MRKNVSEILFTDRDNENLNQHSSDISEIYAQQFGSCDNFINLYNGFYNGCYKTVMKRLTFTTKKIR